MITLTESEKMLKSAYIGVVKDLLDKHNPYYTDDTSIKNKRKNKNNRGYPVSVRTTPKIGRNEPCPCKSGKKYKYCCGR